MKVKCIQPFDGYRRGDEPDLPPRYANGVINKGLAKMLEPVRNKMAPAPSNKANPTTADGEERPSSALPVAPASPKPTAKRRGRPRKSAAK